MEESDIGELFSILEPRTICAPFLFNSPHSGDDYPAEFLAKSRLNLRDLRKSADLFVDQIFLNVIERGIPLMRAHFPRSFLDVNREPYELDPKMFEGHIPAFANTKSLRVSSGFGTIARCAGEAQDIYLGRIPIREALHRIDTHYLPYHAALRRRLSAIHRRFGRAFLIDCHSMPSGMGNSRAAVPDIVLGDRYGTSCAPELIDIVEHSLRGHGLNVHRNQPYAGGFITEHYGNPVTGLHALQIEINRSLYMDETLQRAHSGIGTITDIFMDLADTLVAVDASLFQPTIAAAAE